MTSTKQRNQAKKLLNLEDNILVLKDNSLKKAKIVTRKTIRKESHIFQSIRITLITLTLIIAGAILIYISYEIILAVNSWFNGPQLTW